MSKGTPCQGLRNACRRKPSRCQTCKLIRFGSRGSARRCKLQLEHRNSFMLVAGPASQTTATLWRLITGEINVQACNVKEGNPACAFTAKALHYQRRALATIHSGGSDHGRAHCANITLDTLLSAPVNALLYCCLSMEAYLLRHSDGAHILLMKWLEACPDAKTS